MSQAATLTPIAELSLTFVEGMARIRGMEAFRFDTNAVLCWHCDGCHLCNCADCIKFTDLMVGGRWLAKDTSCGVCKGAGLLTWPPEELC